MESGAPHLLNPEADGDGCGPFAVSAVTWATKEQVESAIREAARSEGIEIDQPTLIDIGFRDLARAVELLGFELFELDGTKVSADSIERQIALSPEWLAWLSAQPTPASFLQNNKHDDVLLCLARGTQPLHSDPEGHSFAVHRGFYSDNNTEDRVALSVRSNFANFHIARALAVRRAAQPAVCPRRSGGLP
jgi:hypothetical protein